MQEIEKNQISKILSTDPIFRTLDEICEEFAGDVPNHQELKEIYQERTGEIISLDKIDEFWNLIDAIY